MDQKQPYRNKSAVSLSPRFRSHVAAGEGLGRIFAEVRTVLLHETTKFKKSELARNRRHSCGIGGSLEKCFTCSRKAVQLSGFEGRIATNTLECPLQRTHADTDSISNLFDANGFRRVLRYPLFGSANLIFAKFGGYLAILRYRLR